MIRDLTVNDCSAFPLLNRDDTEWLRQLASAAKKSGIIKHLEEGRENEEVVYCERDGRWWAGRYIGSITYAGRTLKIEPRFGNETLMAWIRGAFNLALVNTRGVLNRSDWVVPWLLATIWAGEFVAAARHGHPTVACETKLNAVFVRGQLDVSGTVRLRAARLAGVASVSKSKSLANPISAALVCAYSALKRMLPDARTEWLPESVGDAIPHLINAVGERPTLPSKLTIDRLQLAPITERYRSLARLSILIASGSGLFGHAAQSSECKGLLLDVAELWELYVLAVTRRTWPHFSVEHGTRSTKKPRALLVNNDGRTLGFLLPDAIVKHAGVVVAVLDAKYKPRQGYGPQREDLYQISAYLERFRAPSQSICGALIYPREQDEASLPMMELHNPWHLDDTKDVRFITLPSTLNDAVQKLNESIPLEKEPTALPSASVPYIAA